MINIEVVKRLKVERSAIVERINTLKPHKNAEDMSDDQLEEEYCLSGLFSQHHGDDDEEWEEDDLEIVNAADQS